MVNKSQHHRFERELSELRPDEMETRRRSDGGGDQHDAEREVGLVQSG